MVGGREENVMKAILIAGALAAAAVLGNAPPAEAQVPRYEAPWCAVIPQGEDGVSERCDMRSFEMCRQEILGENSAYCIQNPHYKGASQRSAPAAEPQRRGARSRRD
jgi:hypothetical protein